MALTRRRMVALKSLLWAACLAPLVRLIVKGFSRGLGANPIEFVTLSLGIWTLTFLLATLSVSPIRRLTGLNWLIKFRRPIGLFAFFYGLLHLSSYVWLDKFFVLGDIAKDVAKRPFITAGMLAFLLLVPLAITSTNGSIRRLGGRKWQVLHRLIYVSAISGVTHFWWKVKADTRQPAIYAVILTGLLVFRLVDLLIVRGKRPQAQQKRFKIPDLAP